MKINSISIDGFRAYEHKQIFDFTNNEQTANLVLIYAPNGFGKTSFFDAVEWSFTGKIERLKNHVKNNPKAKNLLLNKNNTHGFATIDINFDSNKLLKRQTSSVRNQNNDCGEGKYIVDGAGLENDTFQQEVKKYILSQDLISEFLRTTKPKERFEDLKIFWDYEDDSPLYEKIDEKYKEIDKRYKETKTEYKNYKQDLEKQKSDITKSIDLEKKIEEFNLFIKTHPIKDIKLLNFQSSDYQKFQNDFNLVKTKIDDYEKNLESKRSAINFLSDNLSLYKKNKKIFARLERAESINSVIIDNFREIEKSTSQQKKYIADYSNFLKLNTLYKYFQKDKRKINYLEKYQKKIQNDLNEFKLLNNEKALIDDKLKFVQTVKINIKNYYKIQTNIEIITKNKILLQLVITKEEKKIDEIQSKIEILKKIFLINMQNYNFIDNNIKTNIAQFKLLNQEKEKEKKILTDITNDLNKFIETDQKYKNLIDGSLKYIQEDENRKNCPLCNTNFNSHNQLIEAIFSHTPSNSTIEALQEKQKKLNEKIEEIGIESIEYKKRVEQYTNNKINNLNSILNELTFDKSQNSNKLTQKISLLNEYVDSKNVLDTFMVEHNISIIENNAIQIDNTDINAYKENLYNQLKEYSKKTKLMPIYENKIKRVNLIIDGIKEKKTYRLVNESQVNSKNEIQNSLDSIIDRYQDNLKMIDKYKKKIIGIGLNKIKIILEKQKVNTKKLKKEIDDYQTKYYEFSSTISNEEIMKIQIQNDNNLKYIDKLNDISLDITSLTSKNINIIDLKNSLKNLKKKCIDIKRKYKRLEEIKQKSEDFIQNKINEAFNLPLINDIYKKIEPHPEFDEIKFETKMDGKNSELEIKAKKGDDDEIQPILYFSAAQINVLSLSIFLAKALQNPTPTLKTIFIDDPIQHLDSINILSFIDLMRILITKEDRQLVIATHDKSFFRLLQKKIPTEYFDSKFIELETFGKVKNEDN